ncbi:MAG TPA: four helix bundle protein [Thermoanaerobaculia bacterium]|nr:four helix bundle protein [Thermoanaerobaculia bacterium]
MNLSERTREFSLRIIRLCAALPSNRTTDVIARQILKAGTSPGAHFREAPSCPIQGRVRRKAQRRSHGIGGNALLARDC